MRSRKQTFRRIRIPEDTARFIENLHPEIKRKVKSALQTITSDPDAGKSLRDELSGLRSFRVGRFRIIYRVATKRIIEIVAIGPRKTIYDETYRFLKSNK